MSAILYTDIIAVSATKLQAILDARGELYIEGAVVSNKVIKGVARMITIEFAGGPGETDTLDTTFQAVNVYAPDEGDCVDIARLVRALYTGRGAGTMCDGNPITFTDTNAGPTPIENGTDQHQMRMLFEVQHRGTNL